ncbi:hypothetical protein SAMN02799630_05540 [Paenibacillus sp. UNCCL117]|uniref:hypothetical protein n=1 Tax=unclassified Paenibacillus TaxID=185978 RepID=UPI000881DC4C|nr:MULTISPECIES: hypothetical protein [unclassified Paenibacillus]SDE48789.1 hypothetical protein SAMN04488602_13019 [Paenibacillus sp. cl123]SFW66739.1 hypothetical protein SAMN02799630_05540 [Paenibacillus sp. UNCCL117]
MLKQTSSCPLITITPHISEATHWMPLPDERWTADNDAWSGVRPDKHYRLFYDKYDREYVIVNDRGQLSMIYLAHHGLYLINGHQDAAADNSIESIAQPGLTETNFISFGSVQGKD